MFKQWSDPENGVDYLEHFIYCANIIPYNSVWSGSKFRFRDQDLSIKVYMNRDNQPKQLVCRQRMGSNEKNRRRKI